MRTRLYRVTAYADGAGHYTVECFLEKGKNKSLIFRCIAVLSKSNYRGSYGFTARWTKRAGEVLFPRPPRSILISLPSDA
jgi:hypothetical protein